jgi:hypothetical protein
MIPGRGNRPTARTEVKKPEIGSRMQGSRERKPRYRRRLTWLAIVIVLLVGGYSAIWFYVADRLEAMAAQAIVAFNRGGTRSVDCANPAARGFPFGVGLNCDSIRFEDGAQKVAVAAAAFRSGVRVYNPFNATAELDGPARISVPSGGVFAFYWERLRANVELATDFPDRISVEANGLKAEAGPDADAVNLFSIGRLEGQMRKAGADLDVAANFSDADIDPKLLNGGVLPPLKGAADLTIKDGVNLVRFGDGSLRGHSGMIRTLSVASGETAGVLLAGPFSVADDGLLDADLTVTIRDPKALSAMLATAFPSAANQIRSSFAGLAMLGDNPTLPLKISRGRALLGFIPLGRLPPL